MSWLLLEASSGLRVVSPSYNPPPCLEGVLQLVSQPLAANAIRCFRTIGGPDNPVEEVLMLLGQREVGGRLGEVKIVVGSADAERDELEVLLDCAYEAVRRTNEIGLQLVLDALCSGPSPRLAGLASAPQLAGCPVDNVLEYDGLVGSKIYEEGSTLQRRVAPLSPLDKGVAGQRDFTRHDTICLFALARRKAMLYFVRQDVVPLSLLYSRVALGGCFSPIISNRCTNSSISRKVFPVLGKLAECSGRHIVSAMNQTFAAAFDLSSESCQQLWTTEEDNAPLMAAFTTGGLVCASCNFFRSTSHRDRLFVAAVAMGQLSHWPLEREDAGKLPPSVSLLHITELLLRCCGDGPTFQFVFIGVGSAVCCVFGFPTEVRGTPWGSVKFLDFVREHLVTSKSSVSFDALIEYDNLRNTKQGAANGDQSSSVDHVTNGAKTGREKQRLAIDLALCAAATHPSLTLNQLLREVSQCKFDSSHSASPPEKTGKKLEGGSDLPTFQVICDCLLSCALSFDADRCVSNGPTCTADAARLSLDTVWYAMASHVVVAEMSARRKGRELGCYSLFSLRSSRPSDTAGVASTRRFGVGWFQQLWQGASRTRNSDLVESCEGTGSWTGRCPFSSCCGDDLHVDATQTLRFLSQLNGGPKPLVCDDADTDGGCFHFGAKRRAKSQGLLDPPVFTNQTIVFPISAVGEQYGAMALPTFDAGAEEGFPAVTAFYFVSLEMMKGTTRDAVVQDVVLLEGDKVASEDDVMAVLQKKRTTPDMEPLSACHQLVTYLLEDVWRYNTS